MIYILNFRRYFTASILNGFLQIIQVNLTSENPRPVTPGTSLEFTYSVNWQPTDIPFVRRFDRYLDYNFFEHQVKSHCSNLLLCL